jgi:NitT/TauT family transport system substrate-binding protein
MSRAGEPVRVLLEYLHPWTNDAGFYVASAAGLYSDLGLDVELVTPDPLRGDALAHLAAGEADFAVFPSNRLLVRRDLGQDLVGIAAVNHVALETIQTVVGTGITRPRDLEGRRLALNPTPRGIAMVRHLVSLDGGDPDAVELLDSGVRELTVDDIAAGEADATFGGYWAWDALFGRLEPQLRVLWRVGDIGAPRYHSYLLGARAETLGAQPEIVRALLRATERGFLLAASEPDVALAALERVVPFFPRPILRRSLELIAPTWTHDGRWGEQREELLAGYAAWLAEHAILSTPDVWRGASDNGFLPERPL